MTQQEIIRAAVEIKAGLINIEADSHTVNIPVREGGTTHLVRFEYTAVEGWKPIEIIT